MARIAFLCIPFLIFACSATRTSQDADQIQNKVYAGPNDGETVVHVSPW